LVTTRPLSIPVSVWGRRPPLPSKAIPATPPVVLIFPADAASSLRLSFHLCCPVRSPPPHPHWVCFQTHIQGVHVIRSQTQFSLPIGISYLSHLVQGHVPNVTSAWCLGNKMEFAWSNKKPNVNC
jgi:hypothetical protein